MITHSEIVAWFSGRLPDAWAHPTPPRITADREEITVIVTITPPQLAIDATDEEAREAAAGRLAAWRAETRDARIEIAREAERRFDRKVSWGAATSNQEAVFTQLALPVMTRLRQPQRRVLDTLVESGVARSRADALQWCVRLVEEHAEDWLAQLRSALAGVAEVRDQDPTT